MGPIEDLVGSHLDRLARSEPHMSKLDQLRAQREARFEARLSEARREIIKNPVNEKQKTRMMLQQALADVVRPESNKSNSESNGFDKKAYQREYMRARRKKP